MTSNDYFLDQIFRAITLFGNPVFYVPMIMILWVYKVPFALPLLLALLFIELVCIFIKLLYRKDRPNPQSRQGLFNKIDANSFPSVHSARIALLSLTMIIYYPSISVIISSLILAVLVGYSRIYLKRHYVIDVLGGFLIGIIIALWI